MNSIRRNDLVSMIFHIKKINNLDDINEYVQEKRNGTLMKFASIIKKSSSKEIVHDLDIFLTEDVKSELFPILINDYRLIPYLYILYTFDTTNIVYIENSATKILGQYELEPEIEDRKVKREICRNNISTTLFTEYTDILDSYDIKIYRDMAMNHNSIFTANMLGFDVEKISKSKRLFTRGDVKILYCSKNKKVAFTNNIDNNKIIKIFNKIK